MRPRSLLIGGGTALAIASLVLSGYELTQRFGGEAGIPQLLPLIMGVATALLCIGVLDWAHGLEEQPEEEELPRRRKSKEGPREAAPASAPTRTRTERQAALAEAVRSFERLADGERGGDHVVGEVLTTAAGFARASSATLWLVQTQRRPAGDAAASGAEVADEFAAPTLVQRAHRENDRVYMGSTMPQPQPPEEAWQEVVARRTTLQTADERRARFLVPVVEGRECVGLLRLVVPQGGSAAERKAAAERLGLDLATLARSAGRALAAEGQYNAAVRDATTALYTRRHFVGRFRETVAACRRYGNTAAVLLMDIDGLARLNSRHGEATGDRALREMAALVADNIRDCDSAYRYGGDEFAIILPNTDSNGAMAVAERLCRTIRATRLLAEDGEELLTTVSIGVAEFEEDLTGPRDLVVRADEALRAAKAGGQNRAELWLQKEGGERPGRGHL